MTRQQDSAVKAVTSDATSFSNSGGRRHHRHEIGELRDDSRDEHLRSVDLFDVAHHPIATFRSTSVHVTQTSGTLAGELTIKGITRPVDLHVDYLGSATDPWGNARAIFSAVGTIYREE